MKIEGMKRSFHNCPTYHFTTAPRLLDKYCPTHLFITACLQLKLYTPILQIVKRI